ncbi:MAG: cytochrome P450 [Novosphingobium sp.]
MDQTALPPRYSFRTGKASLRDMVLRGLPDPASVIPDAILHEPAVQLPGYGAPLVVACPDLARQVLNDRADHFTRDRLIRRAFRRTWGKGLAGAEGEDWHAQRRAAAPFFRPQAVLRHLSAFAKASDAVPLPEGKAFDLAETVPRIIARIVTTTMLDLPRETEAESIAPLVADYVDKIAGFSAIDVLPLPEGLIDRYHGIDQAGPVRAVRTLARRLASDWRASKPHDDMMALLDGVGPLEDNLRGLFPAALDTTVSGTSWALYLLATRPDWQARVAAEAQACAQDLSLDKLPITRRVVAEALRLYPPAPMLLRAAAQTFDLGGYTVRRGQSVVVAIYAAHRHRTHWPDPDRFDPDRFLAENGHHAAYLPFGTGPRMCIAAQFALAEIAVVVARISARYRIEPAGDMPQVALQATTRSANGICVKASPRK